APRAVQHEDPLSREPCDLRCDVPPRHAHLRSPKRMPRGTRARLFRRFLTRSPSCRSKLSGTPRVAAAVERTSRNWHSRTAASAVGSTVRAAGRLPTQGGGEPDSVVVVVRAAVRAHQTPP